MSWYDALFTSTIALFSERVSIGVGIVLLTLLVLYRMRPRRVYFVRHGETEANAKRIRQGPEGELSVVGRAQAAAAGAYLSAFPIRAMVSSPYERAAETARIINETLAVPLSYSLLLVERRNPTDIVGKRDDDPSVVAIVDHIDRIYHDDDYRYSDEENFTDLKERAKRCLDLLAHQSARHTIAVTHSIFLKMVIAYLLSRDALRAGDYAKVSFFNASDNAGITICEYRPWHALGRTRGWSVIEYNVTPYDSLASAPHAPPRIPPPIS